MSDDAPPMPSRPENDPAWSRPLVLLLGICVGVFTIWGLTRSGYANAYYSEGSQAGAHSWKALFFNSLDTSNLTSLDKGPLPNLLTGASSRLLGLSSLSVLLPEALCGIASVFVLHDTVKRTVGHQAALLAATILAVSPIFIAMSRYNNPDSLLVFLEICSAWALTRALESGRTRHLLVCGLSVGLAFNTKMMQAYLIVPGLLLAFLFCAQGSWVKKLSQLCGAGVVMVATSFAWYGTMMLIPASSRPWVGDTVDNSWFTLIFEANGLDRVSGAKGGGASWGGQPGILRLFNPENASQIAWLLPLAVAGLVFGLWTSGHSRLERSAYLLWGSWGLASWAIFSFSQGVFHPYYTNTLTPAVAVLAALALLAAWGRAPTRRWRAALNTGGTGVLILGTAALGAAIMSRYPRFLPWLSPTILVLALASVSLLAMARFLLQQRPSAKKTLTAASIGVGLLAVLGAPAAYTITTVGKPLTGTVRFSASNPLAGPDLAAADGSRANHREAVVVPTVNAATIQYLLGHQGHTRYLVAAESQESSAPIALRAGRNVLNIGGYLGSDPSPSITQIKQLVRSGQLRYALLLALPFPSEQSKRRDSWIRFHSEKMAFSTGGFISLYQFRGIS